MIKGSIQKEVFEILINEGVVENLGKTYRSFSNSPRRVSNNQISAFINNVKMLHPEVEFVIGVKGGMETAKLILRSDKHYGLI